MHAQHTLWICKHIVSKRGEIGGGRDRGRERGGRERERERDREREKERKKDERERQRTEKGDWMIPYTYRKTKRR